MRYPNHIRIGIVVVLVLLISAILINHANSTYKIPKDIKKQLNFPTLWPQKPFNDYRLDTSSIKYSSIDADTKVLSFVIKNASNKITFAEQAYPEVLIYDKLANSVQPYSEVGSIYGKITLGRPKDSGGRQVGVLKYGDSTLIFAKPEQDLKDSDWQLIFNSLEVEK